MTVPGPESPEIARGLRGYLTLGIGGGQIDVVALPSGTRTTVRPKSDSSVHAISGPDGDGRIAYVEDKVSAGGRKARHALKTVRIDGTQDTVVFERPGSAMWSSAPGGGGDAEDCSIGASIALAPKGGLVALVAGLRPKEPNAPRYIGTLEVWDVVSRERVADIPDVMSQRVCWFPDCRRVLCVRGVPRDEVPAFARDRMEQMWRYLDPVPGIFEVDVRTGSSALVNVGLDAMVAPDGRSVLVVDALATRVLRVDLADKNKSATVLEWPSGAKGLLAVADGDLLLYGGLPTEGTEVRYAHSGLLSGRRPLAAIKVAKVGANLFQTVVSHVDTRWPIAFGVGP